MKRIILFPLALTVLAGGSLLAGTPDFKAAAPEPPPCDYGTGFYAALEGGANVYQDVNTNRDFLFNNGDLVNVSRDGKVGGWGGIKLGYVFGKGVFRPTIEEDMFYNGIDTDIHVKLNNVDVAHSTNLINSGAFMTNFIGRFAFGKFQPYFGGGIGAYWAEASGTDITFNRTGTTFHTGGGASSGSLAWQVVAGADYYVSCKMSIFIENKYLDYVALNGPNGVHQVGQDLVGAGIRFHF